MSTEEQQGVAQRVIKQWKRESTSLTELYSMTDGLEIMHIELSTEARRILREDFSEKDRLYGYDSEVRQAFEQLGLDLEGEGDQ